MKILSSDLLYRPLSEDMPRSRFRKCVFQAIEPIRVGVSVDFRARRYGFVDVKTLNRAKYAFFIQKNTISYS